MTSGGGGGRSSWAWALALTAAWLAAAGIGWALLGEWAVAAAAALAPVGLIWLAAALAHQGARAGEDRAGLRSEIDGIRVELRALGRDRGPEGRGREPRVGDARGAGTAGRPREPEPPREPERAEEPERLREPERPQDEPAPPALPPAARSRPPELPAEVFVRALDFPEDAEDEAGFAALRRALADPQARRLVQASQDVLTLLSQNGVYMDDLEASPAPPALWRRFAGGVRGPGVADLAGVDDASALELAGARMARDTIFRDAAQHFLRQFDLGLQRFVAHASDEDIAALARTRTARAFMLLARAARLFD